MYAQGVQTMNAIVIEHVPLADLPAAWRAKLRLMASAQVRVRIEEEESSQTQVVNPMFGMWQDREDIADVPAYIESLRQSRFNTNGSRRSV
jgi:hypothetical protein